MGAVILIAEDDGDIRGLLRLYLEGEGFRVVEAADGQAALDLARTENPDMAILDVMMPQLNGYEVTRALRRYSDIPILILSAKSQDNDKILGLNLGADDYVAKPFNPVEIVARVKAQLRRASRGGGSVLTAGGLTLDTAGFQLLKNGRPIPLTRVEQRIGTPYIRIDPEKIRYIVRSDELDETPPPAEPRPAMERVAEHLLDFLSREVPRMPGGVLPPIQTGFGGMAAAIVRKLGESKFENLQFFCGVLQEANMELLASGRAAAASTGSIQMTPRVIQLLEEQPDLFRERVVIRNTDVTNSAEAVSRLGLITLNSGIEMDMYGNVNSSHVAGTKVVNGLGGGAGFASNAGLPVMLFTAETKGGAISTSEPRGTHQDSSEHDVDVVVTDQGVADLRGKDDVERARCIIEHCAGPHYREPLRAYLEKAVREAGGHHPQLLREAFAWHIRLQETGSMLEQI